MVRTMLTAYFLGVSFSYDAFVTSLKLASFLRRILGEGAFSAVFIPQYGRHLSRYSLDNGKKFSSNILTILAIILTVITVFAEVFMEKLVLLIAPGYIYTPERLNLTIEYATVVFPFLIFICLAAFYGSILNTHNKFSAFASSQFVANIFIVLVLIGKYYLASSSDIGDVLIYTVLFSGLIHLVWLVVPCYVYGYAPKFSRPRITPEVKNFFKKILPAFAGSGIIQINVLVNSAIASCLAIGAVSYLDYAERLFQLPMSVIGTAFVTTILPKLTRLYSNKKNMDGNVEADYAVFTFILMLPTTAFLFFISNEVVVLLYQHGEFTHLDSIRTANTLKALYLGLPAYVVLKVLTTTFFAKAKTTIPLISSAVCVGADIVFGIILSMKLAYVGIALASTIAGWLSVFLLLGYMVKRKTITITRLHTFLLLRLLGFVMLLILSLYTLDTYLLPETQGKVIYQLINICLLGSTFVIMFFFFIYKEKKLLKANSILKL